MGKEKLTLSVDKEVIEKAKELGINISEITESILKGYTSAEKPNGDIYDAYRQLFSAITPLLKEFGCEVKIAEGVETFVSQSDQGEDEEYEVPFNIFLQSDGSFYQDEFEAYFRDIKRIDRRDFLAPEKILSNLVDALARSHEARKDRMQQIMMAKRIVDAMSGTLIKGPSTKSDEKG
jgi:hypothetical protein